jgi:hypothetical protein
MFFFEKKNQKTFANSSPLYPAAPGSIIKSFLLLFFKKEGLASTPHQAALAIPLSTYCKMPPCL